MYVFSSVYLFPPHSHALKYKQNRYLFELNSKANNYKLFLADRAEWRGRRGCPGHYCITFLFVISYIVFDRKLSSH